MNNEYVYITNITKVKSSVPYYEIEELESSLKAFSQMMKDPDRLGNIEKTVMKERIIPKEFVDGSGRHYFLGLSQKVQKELRLPMDAFNNMKQELEKKRWEREKLFRERNRFENIVDFYEGMTFWQRIKFCFKGS